MSLLINPIDILKSLKAGHSFVIMLKDCYPINVLSKIKMCDEVVRLYAASSNPLTVLTVEESGGSAIVGVIDGISPKGVENDNDKKVRRDFLKKIGYKF